ncbi:MAG: carbohydrate-binding domain-containing protein [Clostridiales bacterium]|nr:carbohydrate-binding domain-containing protein [Clostridiales bacterium]
MKKTIIMVILSAFTAFTTVGCSLTGESNTESSAGQAASANGGQATSTNGGQAASANDGQATSTNGEQAASANSGQAISTNGEHIITGDINGQILITAEDAVLILDGANITSTDGPAILSEGGDLTVELRGENNVSGASHGIQGKDNLIIRGEGTVNVTAVKDGLHAGNELRIEGGTVNIVESNEGMEAPSIVVSGGKSTVFAADDGINAAVDEGDATTPSIMITGGEMIIYANSDGIDSNGIFDVTGGTVAVFINAPRDGNTTDIDSAQTIQMPILNVNAQVKTGANIAVNDWSITTAADATSFSLILPGVIEGQNYSVLADGVELANVTAATTYGNMGGPGGMGGFRGNGGQMAGMPEGLTREVMEQAMAIIRTATDGNLTEDQKTQLNDLGLTDEQIEQMLTMPTGGGFGERAIQP